MLKCKGRFRFEDSSLTYKDFMQAIAKELEVVREKFTFCKFVCALFAGLSPPTKQKRYRLTDIDVGELFCHGHQRQFQDQQRPKTDTVGIATMSNHSVALCRAYYCNQKLLTCWKRSFPAFYDNLTLFYYSKRDEFNETYWLPWVKKRKEAFF